MFNILVLILILNLISVQRHCAVEFFWFILYLNTFFCWDFKKRIYDFSNVMTPKIQVHIFCIHTVAVWFDAVHDAVGANFSMWIVANKIHTHMVDQRYFPFHGHFHSISTWLSSCPRRRLLYVMNDWSWLHFWCWMAFPS